MGADKIRTVVNEFYSPYTTFTSAIFSPFSGRQATDIQTDRVQHAIRGLNNNHRHIVHHVKDTNSTHCIASKNYITTLRCTVAGIKRAILSRLVR